MPYCTNCGTQVEPAAAYCPNCGAAQRGGTHSTGASTRSSFLESIDDRTACILCYVPVFGIIPCVCALAARRFRANYRVRFHAFQGLYLFVAWLIVSSALPGIFIGLGARSFEHIFIDMARLTLLICWIYMMVQTSNRRDIHLPVLGDLAARSTHEQL